MINKEKYTNDDTDRENAKQSDEIIKKNAKINELEQRIKTYEIDMENQREEVDLRNYLKYWSFFLTY